MKYQVETTPRFEKAFKKLDRYTQKMIKAWIEKHLVGCEDPRQHGKGLTANRSGQWRYRIGDYRLICQINDNELVILALTVGHRQDVYNQNFSKVARLVDESGAVVILKNNVPRCLVMEFSAADQEQLAAGEDVLSVSKRLIEKNRQAYEVLAK